MFQQRRVAVLWIDEIAIMSMFDCWKHKFLSLPVLPPEIKDAEILGVKHSWERRQIGFMLAHPSFAEVPEGEITPSLDITWNDVTLKFPAIRSDGQWETGPG